MYFIKFVHIDASVSRVWDLMKNLEAWPSWTPTIQRMQVLHGANIGVGTKVQIEQPKLPRSIYIITSWNEGKGFVMSKGNFFFKVTLTHQLTQTVQGTRVELSILFSGMFASSVAKKFGAMMDEYLSLEAAGLKAASESIYATPQ